MAVCGVTRAEVLHGVRTAADRTKVMALLGQFAQMPIPETLWEMVGDNPATLRSKGVTVPFPDAVLTTVSIANGLELWTRDAHFTIIQKCLPALKLFQEPP